MLTSIPWSTAVVTLLASMAQPAAPVQVPAFCPVTLPSDPAVVPPPPYPKSAPSARHFWYGSRGLWTMLSVDGQWRGVPPTEGYRLGYRDKLFVWRPGFDGRKESRPALTITGTRLDGDAPDIFIPEATNAHHPDFGGNGWNMLKAVDIPTTGCWQLSARYSGESLTFVVWVTP